MRLLTGLVAGVLCSGSDRRADLTLTLQFLPSRAICTDESLRNGADCSGRQPPATCSKRAARHDSEVMLPPPAHECEVRHAAMLTTLTRLDAPCCIAANSLACSRAIRFWAGEEECHEETDVCDRCRGRVAGR